MPDKNSDAYILSDDTFEDMIWKATEIYAVSFCPQSFELVFDIDHILKWRLSENKSEFHITVAPATLVFENACDIKFDLDCFDCQIQIEQITRTDPRPPGNAAYLEGNRVEWTWEIECEQGTISFSAIGFKIFLRKRPVQGNRVKLPPLVRGESNFRRSRD